MEDKTIRVSMKTYRALSKLGKFGESFDSIISRILKAYTQNKNNEVEALKNG